MKPPGNHSHGQAVLCLVINAVSNVGSTLGIGDLPYADKELPHRVCWLPASLLLLHHLAPLEAALLEPQDIS